MANWKYTINIKEIWDKYTDYSHEDYDDDKELFNKMKDEIAEAIKRELAPKDLHRLIDIGTWAKLTSAKHLSHFNSAWDALYDYCDHEKIWIKTLF